MPRHAGLLGFFIYDFPEESHKAPQIKYVSLSFLKNLTGQAIRLRRKEDTILFVDPGEMVFNFTPVPSAGATGQAGQADQMKV